MKELGFGQKVGQIVQMAYVVEDIRAAMNLWIRRTAFEAPVPSGGSVCYLENGSPDPAFIELIPATPGMDDMFTRFWRATIDWNGQDPIRPFA